MTPRTTVTLALSSIAGPSAGLAGAILLLEAVMPGIVGRWFPVAPLFFLLLALAATGAVVKRPSR